VYPIYLDFNRTTPLAPSVLEAMQGYWTQHFLLPGQEHPQARAVAESLEYARESIATLMGCEAFEIVFTGSGTESNNLAVLGAAGRFREGHMIVSALEHESICNTALALRKLGWRVETVPLGPDGVVDPQRVQDLLCADTQLVCIQAANPIVGTIQPVREIADLCHSQGIAVHCDATQSFGKMPLAISDLHADSVSLSGHKFYGPKGTGALYVRRGYPLTPILYGECREMGLRPGAENVPGWIGLGAAAMLASRCSEEASVAMASLRDHLATSLRSLIHQDLMVLCESSPRLSNTLTIELPVEAKQVQRVARELIFATAMSATPADEMTRCLSAIGRNELQIGRTIRLSIGWTTSREQIDRTVEVFAEAVEATAYK
jgi:cysteine desulfurase